MAGVATECDHRWVQTNQQEGFLYIEYCYHCKRFRGFFSAESCYLGDEYVENKHRWNYYFSSRSMKFDLMCAKCRTNVVMDDLLGIMCCSGCTDQCQMNLITKLAKESHICVLAALFETPLKGEAADWSRYKILNQYYRDEFKDRGQRFLILPDQFRCQSMGWCKARLMSSTSNFIDLAEVRA